MAEIDQNYFAASEPTLTPSTQTASVSAPSALAVSTAWGTGDFSAAANGLRGLAGEIAEMSLSSLEQARRLIEDVRDARDIDDLMVIQTRCLASLFETFAESSHRLGSFFAELPRDMTKASRDMVEASIEAAEDVVEVTAISFAAAAEMSQTATRETNSHSRD